MNKNKDILLDILEKNWEPEQIYNMFPNPSPWKNEIEQEKTGYCWLITELHALMYFMSKKYGTKDIYFSLTDSLYILLHNQIQLRLNIKTHFLLNRTKCVHDTKM